MIEPWQMTVPQLMNWLDQTPMSDADKRWVNKVAYSSKDYGFSDKEIERLKQIQRKSGIVQTVIKPKRVTVSKLNNGPGQGYYWPFARYYNWAGGVKAASSGGFDHYGGWLENTMQSIRNMSDSEIADAVKTARLRGLDGELDAQKILAAANRMHNPWYGESERHREAALLGWRRRRGLEPKPIKGQKAPAQLSEKQYAAIEGQNILSGLEHELVTLQQQKDKALRGRFSVTMAGERIQRDKPKTYEAEQIQSQIDRVQTEIDELNKGIRRSYIGELRAAILSREPYNKREALRLGLIRRTNTSANPVDYCPSCHNSITVPARNPFVCPQCKATIGVK